MLKPITTETEIRNVGGHLVLIDRSDLARFGCYPWHVHRGYVFAEIAGKRRRLHRLILDVPEGLLTDHINGNPLDNRRANLRLATTAQNAWNMRKHRGESVYKGVSNSRSHKGPKHWRARIRHHGREILLGYFATEIEAARAYDEAARRLFGEFAFTNFTN